MIQRYTARDDYENHGPYEDGGGEWVKWEDVEPLICSSAAATVKYMNRYTNLLFEIEDELSRPVLSCNNRGERLSAVIRNARVREDEDV